MLAGAHTSAEALQAFGVVGSDVQKTEAEMKLWLTVFTGVYFGVLCALVTWTEVL